MEPDAAMAVHNEAAPNEAAPNEAAPNEAAPNEATIVRSPVRDFSKIGLQLVQQVHGNTGRSNGFVVKNTAHGYLIQTINPTL
jgi:hypothetical protein